jgi:uncharacterized protein
MEVWNKAIPVPDEETEFYWKAAKNHELMIQKCNKCGKYQHPPRGRCIYCHSTDVAPAKVSGKGKVFTFGIMHLGVVLGFKDSVPYNTTWVLLDEGVRIVCNLQECKNEDIYIGMPVEVCFQDITEEVTLPQFRPATGAKIKK